MRWWYAFFFFQAEDGIRDLVRSRGLGDVYKRQDYGRDEAFQKRYAATAKSDEAWDEFRAEFLDLDEAGYQAKVRELQEATS